MESTGGSAAAGGGERREILLAGIPSEPREFLARRLPTVGLREAASVGDALAEIERGAAVEAVVVDHELPGGGGIELVRRLRESRRGGPVPVLYCAAPSLPVQSARELVNSLGVRALLFHPLDPYELTGRIAGAIAGSVAEKRRAADLSSAVEDARERFRDETPRRLATLDEAAAALGAGALEEEARRRAQREAHTLAGSAGMLGFAEASRLARSIERLLEGGLPVEGESPGDLAGRVAALRAALAAPPDAGAG